VTFVFPCSNSDAISLVFSALCLDSGNGGGSTVSELDATIADFRLFRLLYSQNTNAARNITMTATPAPTPAAIPAENFEESEDDEEVDAASVTIMSPEVVIVDAGGLADLAPREVEVDGRADVLIGPMPAWYNVFRLEGAGASKLSFVGVLQCVWPF
jgi:hypothetical protein